MMSRVKKLYLVCFYIWIIGFLFTNCQILIPPKSLSSSPSFDCNGVETFEKVSGVELSQKERIPLYSSSNGAITADCYNRCRSSTSCSAFWIDYNTSECFRLPQPKFTGEKVNLDFNRPSAYFERLCLLGDICSKAWVSERVPGYELMGYDDVIIKSVVSRKRCVELCLTDKRLPCRSADYWETRKECRLSREDRRSQPGAFARTSPDVEYIENACIQPVAANKGKECEWDVTQGVEFKIFDFTTKSLSLADCQRTCESYSAFTCRSVTFDTVSGICLLSGADTTTTSTILLRLRDKKIYAQRVPCVDMSLECQGEAMVAKLKSHSPFYGKLFSMPISPGCEVFGHGKTLTSITFQFDTCGVHRNHDGSFVATLIVQQHPLIQKRGDSAFRLVCYFPEGNRTLSQVFGFESETPRIGVSDTSASASSSVLPPPILGIGSSVVINSTAKSPAVSLRILDSSGGDVTGVSLGDELFLKVEVEPNSAYGLIARDLIAKSGTNEDELVLLDSRGCPEDPAIFPSLRKETQDSKSLKSRFEAFKFTNDAVVRFQVHLQFCRHDCPPVKCDGDASYGRRRRKREDFDDNIGEILELKREIIVSSQPSANRLSAPLRKNNPLPMGGATVEEITAKSNNPNPEICGSRHLLIGFLVGFSILQVLIVLCAVICVCQKYRDKNSFKTPSLRSPHLIFTRQGNTNFNTIRSLQEN